LYGVNGKLKSKMASREKSRTINIPGINQIFGDPYIFE